MTLQHPPNGDDQTTAAGPVDLDPPNRAIARWKELADRDIFIRHEGDAEKVIPWPRPTWADPDCDIIGPSLNLSYYSSDWAHIPTSYRTGGQYNDDELLIPASLRVRAKISGTGRAVIGFAASKTVAGKWRFEEGVGLTPAEATEFAHAILAAVDLIGGEK
ncbi:hypothetical protein [Mycobacterium marinum]|uniref:hypothetical protein n=1 Tax=Mycobacterium marinum TaxID=1781 RepID=UPI0035680A3A